MKTRMIYLPFIAMTWSIGLGVWNPFVGGANSLYAQLPRVTTKFQVDPFWPKPVPNDLIMGPGSGACIDKADHVFVIQRTADITKSNPNQADEFAPTIVEFNPDGKVVQMWAIRKSFRPPRTVACSAGTAISGSTVRTMRSSKNIRATENC